LSEFGTGYAVSRGCYGEGTNRGTKISLSRIADGVEYRHFFIPIMNEVEKKLFLSHIDI